MVVPFSNRASVATLPALALAKGPATVKEVIDDLAKQCEPYRSVFECVQLVRGRTLRIHFPSADVREDITTGGLTFRGHPLAFSIPSVFKWVSVLDLPYGTPDGEISSVLSKHGQVATIRSEVYNGLYTGTRVVKMTVKSAIPSRLTIAGHVCTVFYRGQVRSCFRCGASGHEAKKCPRKASTQSSDPRTSAPIPDEPIGAMQTTPPSSPRSFANVVSGLDPPKVIATPSPRLVSPVTLHPRLLPTPGPTTVSSMDADTHSQKRPYSPVSESEWTDTDDGGHTRPRLDDQNPNDPIILDKNIRDRSPLQKNVVGNDSSSDSSGKSPTSKASVIVPPVAQPAVTGNASSSDSSGKSQTSTVTAIVPPAAQPVVPVAPLAAPNRPLDRRLLSVRLGEYCPTAPEYTPELQDEVIEASLELEHVQETGSDADRKIAEIQLAYDHLQLDHSVAVTAYNSAYDDVGVDDSQIDVLANTMTDIGAAVQSFEAAHPQVLESDVTFTQPD